MNQDTPPAPYEEPPRLLIIEDDEPTARALRVLFHQGAGWGVFWGANVAEARGLLAEYPDSVLLDLMLPDGKGEDLIEEIRDRCPNCRIVVVTAISRDGHRINAVAGRNPDAIVHKPYEFEDLMAAVKGETPSPE